MKEKRSSAFFLITVLLCSMVLISCSDSNLTTKSENLNIEFQENLLKPTQTEITKLSEPREPLNESNTLIDDSFKEDEHLITLKEKPKDIEGKNVKSGGYSFVYDVDVGLVGQWPLLEAIGHLTIEASWLGAKSTKDTKAIQPHEMLFRSMSYTEPSYNVYYMYAGLKIDWWHPGANWATLLPTSYYYAYGGSFIGIQYYKNYMARWDAKARGYHHMYNIDGSCTGCYPYPINWYGGTYATNHTW